MINKMYSKMVNVYITCSQLVFRLATLPANVVNSLRVICSVHCMLGNIITVLLSKPFLRSRDRDRGTEFSTRIHFLKHFILNARHWRHRIFEHTVPIFSGLTQRYKLHVFLELLAAGSAHRKHIVFHIKLLPERRTRLSLAVSLFPQAAASIS